MQEGRLERLQLLFRHFGARLYERYNILITFEEYLKVCNECQIKNGILVERENKKASIVGFIKIKSKKIKVCRQINKPRGLITALPLNYE